ncbi:MAG: hypothetical protein RL368_1102 [Pseudomonadota bacterium]
MLDYDGYVARLLHIFYMGEKSEDFLNKNGGSCAVRTHDHRIKSPMLYRLS